MYLGRVARPQNCNFRTWDEYLRIYTEYPGRAGKGCSEKRFASRPGPEPAWAPGARGGSAATARPLTLNGFGAWPLRPASPLT